MATDVNSFSRKRKSSSDLIFEVDEDDCSPSSTPEPQDKSVTCSISETEASSQASTDGIKRFAGSEDIDVSKISLPPEEPAVQNIEIPKLADDLSCVDMDVASPQPASIDKPFITVVFRDKDVASKYKSQIINYIKSVVPLDLTEDYNSGFEINLWENHLNNVNPVESNTVDLFCIDTTPTIVRDIHRFDTRNKFVIDTSKNLVDHRFNQPSIDTDNVNCIGIDTPAQKVHLKRAGRDQACIDIGITREPHLDCVDIANKDSETEIRFNVDAEPFIVDTTPSKSRETLPRYSPNQCDVLDVLDPKQAGAAEKDAKQYRPQTSCFNCDGPHALRDCKEPKDYRRIGIARQKYMASAPVKSVRYHLDDEQKYKHLVPGQISDKLRKALNLRKYEIPPYVYRMRMLGYPPGWLQEAMVAKTTKLDVFDFQGCAVQNGVDGITSKVIDKTKIVDYPGFNVPLEKGHKDDYKYFQCPAYSEDHSVTAMVDCVEKMVSFTSVAANKMPGNAPSNVPAKDVLESDGNSLQSQTLENTECRAQSPTLTDLELRKRQLLAELEDGSLLNSPLLTENIDKTPKVPTTPQAEIPDSPLVVSSTFGTPVLKSASPFASLPDPDKFSKDISQMINFENLPDATGKYEQMTKVINKVRDIVKNNITAEHS